MKKEKSLIIIKEDSYFIIEQKHLENISSIEAASIALSTLNELRKTLVDEAIMDKVLYVGKQKLVDGLDNTLTFLYKNYPSSFTKTKKVTN